jgi:hypothetical protein
MTTILGKNILFGVSTDDNVLKIAFVFHVYCDGV